MTAETRIASLRSKHDELEAALAQEFKRPHPDEEVLRELKQRKLRLKDMIAATQGSRTAH